MPFQNVSSSSTFASGVRLWAIAAFQTRSASASLSRIVTLIAERELDLADVAPDGVAVPAENLDLVGASNSSVPIAFHMSA